MTTDTDEEVLKAIQSRFEVAIPELPEHIEPSSYMNAVSLFPNCCPAVWLPRLILLYSKTHVTIQSDDSCRLCQNEVSARFSLVLRSSTHQERLLDHLLVMEKLSSSHVVCRRRIRFVCQYHLSQHRVAISASPAGAIHACSPSVVLYVQAAFLNRPFIRIIDGAFTDSLCKATCRCEGKSLVQGQHAGVAMTLRLSL